MIIREFGCGRKMLRSLIVFVLASSVLSSSKHAYHGVIREDAPEGAEVELDVPLNARTGEICSYTVFSSVPNLPFKVIQEDLTGEVKIVLGRGFQLDYETRSQYDFEIEAHSCNSNAHSQKESVHIEVEDVDDLDPDWRQRSYYAEVVEGKIYDRLVHLEATELEGYDAVSEVCRYRILTPNMPFQVDADGYLRNTEPLDYNKKHSYAIEVAAIDCSSHKSDKIFVNIEVKALCRPGWIGLQDRVEFSPREGRKLIAPEAELELCDRRCNLTRIAVTAKLTTTHIGKGCDRDTYSLQSQRKLCGASDGTIDLLPSPSVSGWTKDLPTDDGQESDQIFAFDGRMTAVEIPRSRVDPDVGRQFSISTWMKHEDEEVEEDHRKGKGRGHNGIKEHILCHSDGEEMNRQHYALYVHNCRLVLLLRREPGNSVDMNSLRPGEWRWKIPEVCDKKWHHYAINMNFPEAELYIDGKRFIESKHNPEVLDEWPLHPTKHVHFTKLVVGACWLGGKNHMGHFFRGYLAGLSILKNRTESDHVIQCLNTCQEKLDFPGIDDMENGMTVSMNNEMTSITVSGITVDSVEKLLRRITYINSRTFPTPGHRPFSLETRATCSDGKVLPVDSIKTLIMVLEPEKPIIIVTAAKAIQRDEHGLVHGEKIFHNLTISAFTKTEANERVDADEKDVGSPETIDSGDTYLLDSCLIRVNPQLNLEVEHFRYPENLLTQLRMEADISEDGLVIAGADKLSNYEEVLRGVRYVNARPEELNSRTFLLTCTELNGRFVSNQLDVTIEVNHVQHERTQAPQAIAVHKVLQPQAEISHQDRSVKVDKMNSDTQTVTGIVIMCVVCAGFIVLLIVLGVLRIRNARRHIHDVNVEEKQEMEWDNSALTITVNPMDQEALYDETYDQGLRCGDSDSDDEGSLHDHEAESSDGEPEEETEKAKTKELEWDDSTLSF